MAYATLMINQSIVPVAPVGVTPNVERIENDPPDAIVFTDRLPWCFAACAADAATGVRNIRELDCTFVVAMLKAVVPAVAIYLRPDIAFAADGTTTAPIVTFLPLAVAATFPDNATVPLTFNFVNVLCFPAALALKMPDARVVPVTLNFVNVVWFAPVIITGPLNCVVPVTCIC